MATGDASVKLVSVGPGDEVKKRVNMYLRRERAAESPSASRPFSAVYELIRACKLANG